jgi:hypothetical protein
MEENDIDIIVNGGINRFIHNTLFSMDENVKKCILSINFLHRF